MRRSVLGGTVRSTFCRRSEANMNEAEMTTTLKRFAGFFEVYRKICFEGYRNAKNGTVQTVSVEILDAGPAVEQRYHCIATSEDGETATGNPAATIDEVLAIVHWQDLDR